MDDSTTVWIQVGSEEETLELPPGVLSYFSEEGESPAAVVGDMLALDCTQRLHAMVHHSEGEPNDDLVAAESAMVDRFNERFDVDFAELIGHEH